MIDLRPAFSDDYHFALELYIQTIKPLASAWAEWVESYQRAQFASLWRPDDTRIIVLDGKDIGWMEFRQAGEEIFFKQLYIHPAHQRRGIGSGVMQLLLDEQALRAKSIGLFVLKNNPAFFFYKRHGFEVLLETSDRYVMRRVLRKAA